MTIRPAASADHDAVVQIIRGIPSLPQWTQGDLAHESAVPRADLVRRALLVAVEHDLVCGFAQIALLLGEAELEGMAVVAGKRHRGTGTALLHAAMRWAEGAGASLLRLEVRAGNRAAIGLYSAAGLQVAGTRRSYYRNPTEDALVMQRNL